MRVREDPWRRIDPAEGPARYVTFLETRARGEFLSTLNYHGAAGTTPAAK